MAQLREVCKKIILMVIMISIIMGSCAVPNSYAKLTIQDGEFYYAGTTKGSYVPSEGIFSWIFDMLAQIASFLLALIPNVLRMAFVGYAAGGEKLLTWALESTSGVNAQGEDINSTDLTALSDSTNNVTVQSIVYNMLPALNVNFFDVGKTKKELYIKEIKEKDASGALKTKKVVISPTGQQLNCKKCGKSVLECCGELDDDIKEIKCYATGTEGKNDCGCNGCEACKKYAQLMAAKDPIIVQLKTLIAVWYYLIQLLAVAAMAVVLIAVGIKMAISTIASDKAVYKRMLVDWVGGVIIIFTMHYIMYFAININETLVNIVRESANAINKVQLAELADTKQGNEEVEKSNQDIEIDVYEEIRTRAYDMKMTVGLVGMIMYITMVFMAFKYTLIYIKRWLTLAVLTLMAPGIGVAYALQKVLSGKSSSLKTWLTEYMLNLVIQVVHALIYAIFISAALAYSLQNVSGVIIALILMNFSLKAEGIFRRIFNLDPGNKGLLGSTETAGDKDKIMNKAKSIKGMMLGASPVSKALTFPQRAIAGAAGKTIAAGALAGGAKAANLASKVSNHVSPKAEKVFNAGKEKVSNKLDSIKQGNGFSGKIYSAGKTITKPISLAGNFVKKHSKKLIQKDEDKELRLLGEAELQKKFSEAASKYEKNPHDKESAVDVLEANRRLERYREITLGKQAGNLTVGGVVAGHVKGVFDINNYFDVTFDKNGNRKYEMKSGLIFGNRQYNPETGRFEKDTSNAAYTQLGASKLLGFTKKDKEIFKQQIMAPALKGVGGLAAMFMGMGTFVGHPAVGLGLLAGGAVSTGGMAKRFHRSKNGQGRLKVIHGYKVQGSIIPFRLKFGSFDTPTVANMRSKIVMQANRELAAQLTKDIENRHPGFRERIKNGLLTPKTIIPATAGIAIGTISLPAGLLAAGIARKGVNVLRNKKGYKDTTPSRKQDPKNKMYKNRYDPYGYEADSQVVRLHSVGASAPDIVDSHHFKQLADQRKVIDDETADLMGEVVLNKGRNRQSRNMNNFNKQIDELLDKQDDEATQVAIMAALGFVYDPKTGTKTSINDELDVEKRDLCETIDIVDESGNITEREITAQDVKRVNEALNEAILTRIMEKAERGEEIDINSEAMLLDIVNDVSKQSGIKELLSNNQGVEVLFKGNMNAIKETIKDKAASANNFAKAEMAKNLQLTGEEFDVVKEAIIEVAKDSASSDGEIDMSTLNQDKIFAKVQDKLNESSKKPSDAKSQKSGKKETKNANKVDSSVDQILEKSKAIAYKKAINTLLTDKSENSSVEGSLKVNINDGKAESKIDSVLNLQTGVDSLQIRDRMITEKVTSRKVDFTKKQSKAELAESKEAAKKSVRRKMFDLLDSYSNTAMNNPESDETIQDKSSEEKLPIVKKAKKMSVQQKLDQAVAAIDTIIPSIEETKPVRDTMIQTLLDMAEMQQELITVNEYAQENFSPKIKGKRKQKYLQAVQTLSDAKQEKNRVELTELKTGKPVSNERKKKTRLDVLRAENTLAQVGPVQDVVKASQDIVAEMKKKR